MTRNLIISIVVALIVIGVFFALSLQNSKLEPDPDAKQPPEVTVDGPPVETVVPDKTQGPPVKPVVAPVTDPKATTPSAFAGTLNGKVVTEEGLQPIEGAIVLVAVDAPIIGVYPTWIDSAETNKKGRFDFAGLRPAAYRLRVSAAGRQDADVSVSPTAEEIEIRMDPDEEIRCLLLLSTDEGDDVPLSNKAVTLEVFDIGWERSVRSDAAGVIPISGMTRDQLDQDWRRIEVVVEGFADPYLMPSKVGDAEFSFSIVVDRAATVSGRVLDKVTGRGLANATVVSDYGHTVVTDANGSYRVAGVEDGLTATAPGYAAQTKEIDDFEPGQEIRIDFELTAGVTLMGKVTSKDGSPISDVWVGVALDVLDLDIDEERMELRLREQLSSVTGEVGEYRIDGLPPDALDLPGIIEIETRPRSSGHGLLHDVDIDVSAGQIMHDFVLDIVSEVVGTVRRSTGEPVVGARILAESMSEDNYQVTATDQNGSFKIEYLPAGDYKLAVQVGEQTVHLQTFSVPSAEALDVWLQPGRVIRGVVESDVDGHPMGAMRMRVIYLSANLSLSAEHTTNDDGEFTLKDVPSGIHVLEIRRPPPSFGFHREKAVHRVNVDVSEKDWDDTVSYPSHAGGELAFHFFVQAEGGGPTVLEVPVTVFVHYYRRERYRVGNPKGTRRGIKVAESSESYYGRFREGEYLFGFRATLPGGKTIQEKLSVKVESGAGTEHEIVFKM